jgi:hypothetical protein
MAAAILGGRGAHECAANFRTPSAERGGAGRAGGARSWLSLFDAAVLPAAEPAAAAGVQGDEARACTWRERPYIIVVGGMQNLEDYQGPELPPVRVRVFGSPPRRMRACLQRLTVVRRDAAADQPASHSGACRIAHFLSGRGRAVHCGEVFDGVIRKCVHTARPASGFKSGGCFDSRVCHGGGRTGRRRLGQWQLVGCGRSGGESGGGVGTRSEHDQGTA